MKSLALLLLLMHMFLSAGFIKGEDHVTTIPLDFLIHKETKNSRKLMGLDAILDYDYAVPNVKHDPRGRKATPKTP